jgi:hypothetical protein
VKPARTPAIVLSLLYVGFAAYLAFSTGQLPDRVATHFNLHGQPNGWMSRSAHLRFILILGLALPLFMAGVCFVARFLPANLINIPHRDYWLSVERRRNTLDYLFAHSLWLSCLTLAFVSGVHFLVVQANNQMPRQLSTPLTLALAGGFLAGLAIWIWGLVRRFRRIV